MRGHGLHLLDALDPESRPVPEARASALVLAQSSRETPLVDPVATMKLLGEAVLMNRALIEGPAVR